MPYRRSRRRSRRAMRPRRQATWKSMVGIGKQLYSQYRGPIGYAIKGVNMLKNLVNAESKFLDTTISTSPDATTGSVVPLTLVAQGTTDITRVGNSILCKDLTMRLQLIINASATATSVRYIIFLDKQNAAGTAPTVANLLQSVGVNQPLNRDNADRFVVMKTGTVDLSINGARVRTMKIYKDLSRLHVKYDGTTAAQSDAAERQLYIAFVSSEATNFPSVTGVARVHFYDN